MDTRFDDDIRQAFVDDWLSRAGDDRRRRSRIPHTLYRTLVQDWVERELFCPRCGAIALKERHGLRDFRDFPNYVCEGCGREIYLIDNYLNMRGAIRSNHYRGPRERIEAGCMPDVICLRYDRERYEVADLFVVPGSCLRTDYLQLGVLAQEPEEGHDIWCDISVWQMAHELGEAAVVDIVRDGVQHGPEEVMGAMRAADELAR